MAKSDFNSTLVAQRLNLKFRRELVISNITNRHWEGELKDIGDTVRIVRPTGTTIRSYDNSTDITIDELDGSGVTLTADQADYFAFFAHDDENIAKYVDAFVSEDAYKLLSAADAYVLQHYADALAANVVDFDPGSDDFVEAIREARARLTKQDVPEEGRYMVIGPDELNLVEDKLVQRGTALGDDAVRRGYSGQLAGFSVFVSNNLVEDDDGTDQFRHCLYGHTSAITWADAMAKVESMRSENRFADIVRGLHIYGSKVIDSSRLGEISHKFAAV